VYDISTFGLQQMIESGRHLRTAGEDACSMQDAAGRVADHLFECFRSSATGEPSFALVRCFKTHPLAQLPPSLQPIEGFPAPDPDASSATRCLALLASRGIHPDWNSPTTSRSHQAIPLASARIVEDAPMIARLVAQMGLKIEDLLHPEAGLLLDLETHRFNIFHVEQAVGCKYLPAQQSFIVPYKVRSVVGFGGPLPHGEIFAVVLFSRSTVSRETAALFRTLALSVKLALLPFAGRRIFND
jgi:hypothetical protein